VLSAFFGLLALMAYARYAQGNEEGRMQNAEMGKTPHASRSALHAPRPRLHVSRFTLHASTFYLLSLLLFSLGLMSKAMLVTLPFVMLLLDYWPLRRLELSTHNPQPSTTLRLLWEKTPFFLLALAASAVTLVVQRQSGALAAGEALSLGTRSQNALVAYVLYIGKLVCPTGLGVFYWHPGQWPLGGLLLSGGVILAVSALAWVQRRRQPYLLMGWLWYCGMLVPVSQVVQTGGHAMADRYTYLPSLGLLILVVWGLCELTRGWRPRVPALAAASGVAIILCVALTRHQIDYWRDSETLFRHDLEVTANNFMAHNNLGGALHQSGRLDEASREFQEAVRLNPDYAESRHNLGTVLYQLNRLPEAVSQLQEAIRLQPDHARAHNNLGLAFYRQGNTAEATAQFLEALRIDPGYADPRKNLDVVLGANPLGSPLPGTPASR
jgi:tetratricopeptide (TPR) repeat protein